MKDSDNSVTVHIANLRQGKDLSQAQQFIWERYFSRIAELAKKRLGHGASRAVSGEDVAATVLTIFFDRISQDGAISKT